MDLRLRQLCLVAHELEPVVADLCAVFGVPVCHRDPAVARFGLHNAMMPLGTTFVEVVAPIADGTAAARYLQRRGGDGGYMVIFDTQALAPWREHVARIGVRIAADLAAGDYQGVQLHPRDTGGALLEINTTEGGADLRGAYGPAGPHWQQWVPGTVPCTIAGAVLQADDPEALAQRWAGILQAPARRAGTDWQVPVGDAVLRFVRAEDGRGEGLGGIDLRVADASAVRERAAARGLPVRGDAVEVGGVRFHLR